MNLDYYTIKTATEITPSMMPAILQNMGLYSQPQIVGSVFEEGGDFFLRFAIRTGSIRPYEDEFIANVEAIIGGKIELTRATRL